MRVSIDMAGRVVIPKAIRDEIGLAPGTVAELTIDGAGLRIDPPASPVFIEDDGFLVIPATDPVVTTDQVRGLRLADQA